ncbi:antirestriction protein ArdA [uncultured Draconibacterium sp.]|uniref:antirestriction protein ArdA n=1 Tax=uncultured Draconibacterium sp. TaxID=1573823 RepID=UPI0025DAF505|nr:antirestriction protein ArdA [uncultured Draconibacterium sp.]
MKLFLTDYASYNEGTQFEFGHWVELEGFSSADDFIDYIKDHFAECDEKRPLLCGTPREETMFTDYEDMPSGLYSESMSFKEIETLFNLIDFMNDNGLDNLNNEGDNLLFLWNEYCQENGYENEIYNFDDDFFNTFLSDNPMEAFRLGCFSDINWNDDYIYFNGYGNLESVSDPSGEIDETALIDWIIETKI